MLSKRRKPVPFRCYIDVSAFVAILLAFLFIFMPMVTDDLPLHAVDLAKAAHSAAMAHAFREDAIMITVQRDGRLYLNNAQFGPHGVTAGIQEQIRSGAEKKVYLRADARARYKAVIAVIDAIHQAGIEDIGIITEQRHSSR